MSSGSSSLASSDQPLHRAFDSILLDLDGVVYVGADAVAGAADALRAAADEGAELAYLTNNASRPANVVAEHLVSLGMPVSGVDSVVTSAQAITHLMATELPAGSTILVVGGRGLRESAEQNGFRCVESADDEPIAVVQGYDPDVGWRQLAEAAYAIGRGAQWFASNTDLTIPTPRGIAPGNGSLVQAVRIATGAEPVVAGKPERPLFDETFDRLSGSRPLMVGDRLDTDIDGAINAGIASLAVLTGVTSLDELFAVDPGHRPSYVSADLSGLCESHPVVTVDGSQARCGAATARENDGVVEVEGVGPRDTAGLRAAVQLAWSKRDASDVRVRAGGTLKP